MSALDNAQSTYRSLIAAWVIGAGVEPPLPPGFDESELVACLAREGMTTLLASRLGDASLAGLTDSSRTKLQHALHDAVAKEMLSRPEIARVISALAEGGVNTLLLKGAPLAYTIYPGPWLRPACDTDIFIHAKDRSPSRKIFEQCGYRQATAVTGDVVSHQFSMLRQGDHRNAFNFDVHWKISNPQAFCNLLSLDEMLAQRLPVPELGTDAYGPSPVHALLHALIHRVAHFAPADRMIWLYDIHLLSQKLNQLQWREFIDIAIAKHIGTICLDGLETALALFPAQQNMSARHHLEELRRRIEPQLETKTALFIGNDIKPAARFRSDLSHLSWQGKLRLIREHLFPPVDYIQQHYKNENRFMLPFLYLRRVLRGAAKALRHRTG